MSGDDWVPLIFYFFVVMFVVVVDGYITRDACAPAVEEVR